MVNRHFYTSPKQVKYVARYRTLGCGRMANHPSGVPRDEPVSDDSRSVFGANLRAARIKAGLTQAQLAERTGLTQQYVSLVEAGHQNITIDTMTALARAVGQDAGAMLRKVRGRIRPR